MLTSKSVTPPALKIAVTGATGFLGTHFLAAAGTANIPVRALTRRPRESDDHVTWVEGSIDDTQSLERTFEGADLVIHMAGLTKALNRNAFFDTNLNGAKNALKAAQTTGTKRFFLLSSLAAREPLISHYGASKAAAESAVQSGKWPFKWTIIRPPAIYGPYDLEILKILKSSRWGILPAPGSQQNRFSMIHAKDLAQALLSIPESGFNSDIIEIDDGHPNGYQISDIANAIADIDGKRPKLLTVPFPVLAGLGLLGDCAARISRKPSMLTFSSARHLSHPDWVIRSRRRPTLPDWRAAFDLQTGLENTIDWYRQNGYL